MVNFEQFVRNVLGTLKTCGVPFMPLMGLCDDSKNFPNSDLSNSVSVSISDSFIASLGHGDIGIVKGNNGYLNGVMLSDVSSNFLNLIESTRMFYGQSYKSIKRLHSNSILIFF